ncbi:Potassium voltage-gated channel protein Shaker [Hypsibius exemplaris]|uniref:Potassium voltage-gated channel protein Shaker n=1 Tax=Hypsibius exemplaris TaxID=2072580 RepID=A0A1W0WE29_HYPEX|nr:Potassium voltage-gated channel protein Shaker [Hypsibius exemplaris]
MFSSSTMDRDRSAGDVERGGTSTRDPPPSVVAAPVLVPTTTAYNANEEEEDSAFTPEISPSSCPTIKTHQPDRPKKSQSATCPKYAPVAAATAPAGGDSAAASDRRNAPRRPRAPTHPSALPLLLLRPDEASRTSADSSTTTSHYSSCNEDDDSSVSPRTPSPAWLTVPGYSRSPSDTSKSPSKDRSRSPSPFLDVLGRLTRRLRHAGDAKERNSYGSRQRLDMTQAQASSSWDMVYFIAGGHHFSCPEWILGTHPDTLLGNAEKRKRYFSATRGCYVFPDTLPDVFSAVLEYYEGEILMRPGRIGLRVYLEQVDLFQLDPQEVENLLIREGIRFEHFSRGHTHINYQHFKHPYHAQLWDILENPETSVWAKFISALSMGLTVLSVVLFCLETLPELAYLEVEGAGAYAISRNPIFILNTICVIYFSLELILRFVVCPDKKMFAKQLMNWVDLFAVVPYFMTLTLILSDVNIGSQTSKLAAVRVIRLFRILRIFDLSRHYKLKSVGVLVQAIRSNLDIIAVLIFLLLICDILFSGFIYAVEGGPDNTFKSIPDAFWWSVITMTSVGYGDQVPQRALGQLVACVCGVVGLIFIAFVLQSIASEFHGLMKTYSEYNAYLKLYDTDRRFSSKNALTEAEDQGEEITVSVNGNEFIFKQTELDLFPNTLLGCADKRAPYYNPKEKFYFFPRNTDIFPSIHYYYRSKGVLQRPPFVALRRFIDEIEFFQLGRGAIIPLLEQEGIFIIETPEPKKPRQKYWFHVFENLEYNLLAKVVATISIAATSTSVLVFCIETMEQFQTWNCSLPEGSTTILPEHHLNTSRATFQTLFSENCTGPAALFLIETLCVVWFAFELTIRLVVSPNKWKFLRSVLNFIDFLAILPYFVSVAELFSGESSTLVVVNTLGLLRTIRLIKLVRLFKFSRHSRRIQMIFEILKATWAELGLAVYFLLIASVLFGSFAYIAEVDSRGNEHISSIPRGMYWAWITMLTIGYGDVVPMTVMGKVVGSLCAVIGLVFWSIPMTFVADKFDLYRRLYKDRDYLMGLLQKLKKEAQDEMFIKYLTNGADHANSPLLTINDGGEDIPLDADDKPSCGASRRSSRKSVSLSALNHSCLPGSTSILSLQFGEDHIRPVDDSGSQRAIFGAMGISFTTES